MDRERPENRMEYWNIVSDDPPMLKKLAVSGS